MAVLAAAFANCRRVDNGHHLADVFLHQPVKECFIPILQSRQKPVTLVICIFSFVVFVGASELLLDCGTVRWQQTRKPELPSLTFGESTSLVEQRVVQQELSSEVRFDRRFRTYNSSTHRANFTFATTSIL